MAALNIHVTGTGQVTRPAERAILVLDAYSQQLPTAEEASTVVTATTVEIRDSIAPYCPQNPSQSQGSNDTEPNPKATAISHYSMSTLDTTSHRSRQPNATTNEYETTYSARAQFHIKFSDFTVLDRLATHFSARKNITIKQIDWHLTDATLNSIKGSARKRAAQDAIQRARDYAEVFAGISEEEAAARVQAVDIKENSYYSSHTRPQLHFGKAQRVAGDEREGKAELMFQPEDVRLEVQVTGTFEIEV